MLEIQKGERDLYKSIKLLLNMSTVIMNDVVYRQLVIDLEPS